MLIQVFQWKKSFGTQETKQFVLRTNFSSDDWLKSRRPLRQTKLSLKEGDTTVLIGLAIDKWGYNFSSYFDREGGLHRPGSRRFKFSDSPGQSDTGQEAASSDGEPGLWDAWWHHPWQRVTGKHGFCWMVLLYLKLSCMQLKHDNPYKQILHGHSHCLCVPFMQSRAALEVRAWINMCKMTSSITPRATRVKSEQTLTFSEPVDNSWQSNCNMISKTKATVWGCATGSERDSHRLGKDRCCLMKCQRDSWPAM